MYEASPKPRRKAPGDADPEAVIARLAREGILRREGERWRTTPRWQAAMMRAAKQLLERGEKNEDLRVPMAHALEELYKGQLTDREMIDFVTVLAPIEERELFPALEREA